MGLSKFGLSGLVLFTAKRYYLSKRSYVIDSTRLFDSKYRHHGFAIHFCNVLKYNTAL